MGISVLVELPQEFSVPFHSAVIGSNAAASEAAAVDLLGIYTELTRAHGTRLSSHHYGRTGD